MVCFCSRDRAAFEFTCMVSDADPSQSIKTRAINPGLCVFGSSGSWVRVVTIARTPPTAAMLLRRRFGCLRRLGRFGCVARFEILDRATATQPPRFHQLTRSPRPWAADCIAARTSCSARLAIATSSIEPSCPASMATAR